MGGLDTARPVGCVPADRATGLAAARVIAALAATLTILVQGVVFGWSNNLFRVPFVEGRFDDPVFAQDGFVQTLRFFASWVWSAAVLLVREVGPRGVAGLSGAMLGLALADGLHRTSRVGGQDLDDRFFSHSGVTWPVILAWLLWLLRGPVVAAARAVLRGSG